MKSITYSIVFFQEVSEAKTHLSFKISNLEAFIAYTDNPSETVEVTPQGSTYTNATNENVKVVFPQDIVESPVKVQIKVCDQLFILI